MKQHPFRNLTQRDNLASSCFRSICVCLVSCSVRRCHSSGCRDGSWQEMYILWHASERGPRWIPSTAQHSLCMGRVSSSWRSWAFGVSYRRWQLPGSRAIATSARWHASKEANYNKTCWNRNICSPTNIFWLTPYQAITAEASAQVKGGKIRHYTWCLITPWGKNVFVLKCRQRVSYQLQPTESEKWWNPPLSVGRGSLWSALSRLAETK